MNEKPEDSNDAEATHQDVRYEIAEHIARITIDRPERRNAIGTAVVDNFARQLAKNAPVTLQRYKQMVVKGADLPVFAALRLDPGMNPYLSEDRAEGVRAFVEKRDPQWRGR